MSTITKNQTNLPAYTAYTLFSPLSALHNSQHLSHSPFLRAFMLQPLVVTVMSLLPSNQVMDWPPLSRKSAVGSLQTQIRPCSSYVNELGKVYSNAINIFCNCILLFCILRWCWCSFIKDV